MAEGRTEFLARGLYLPNGKPILSTPSPEQIAAVNANPKARLQLPYCYFLTKIGIVH